jgi:thiol-disulfide isomerase/thioredoxin
MKKIIFILITVGCLFVGGSNVCYAQVSPSDLSVNQFRIQGTLTEPLVLEGDSVRASKPVVYLLDAVNRNVLDSTVLSLGTHGSFQFVGKVESPSWKVLQFKWRNPVAGYGEYSNSALVPVEAGVTSVSFNVNQSTPDQLIVKGTNLAKDYTTYLNTLAQTEASQIPKAMKELYAVSKDKFIGALYLCFLFDNKVIKSSAEAVTYLEGADNAVLISPLIVQRLERLREAEKSNVGQPYLNVTGINPLTGASSSLSAFVGKGKVVVLDFWGSWCVPCRNAIPKLKELHAKYGQKVIFVGIAINDTQTECTKAIKDLGIGWDVIQFTDGQAAKAYDVSFVPTLVVISKEGKIIDKTIPLEALEDRLNQLEKP